LKEDDRSDKIEDALKHLGNVRKKKMSPNVLKDFLGDDGNPFFDQLDPSPARAHTE